ncbi:MAG: hypothetical protein ABSF10_00645 [Verrucomicrobiota bacterium]|jgi:hypothetical protein
MATLTLANAAPILNTGSPVSFFTNVASRLLSSELNLNLTGIQVYPTNQYTPAVHRLLQVTANVFDASTTNFYPSVFRPIFSNDGANVFITGYEPVVLSPGLGLNDPHLTLPMDVTTLPLGTSTNNVYGIPWIIGAKKGFPNFNEFSMESIVQVTRRLEITRPSINAPLNAYQTNQMYILSISNLLGVECWNSYNSNYVSLSQIQILARDSLSMMLTNEEPGGAAMPPLIWINSPYVMTNSVSLSTWPGSAPWVVTGRNRPPSPNVNSFALPLNANAILLTNSVYVYNTHSFIPASGSAVSNYLDQGITPMPQFGLLTTNRLQVVMLDGDQVIDYVQFAGPESSRNLNAEITDYDPGNPNIGLWNTNYFGAGVLPNVIPYGVVNQIYYALNPQQNVILLTANDDRTWRNPPGGGTVGQEIASLNAFFNPNHMGFGTDPNTGNTYLASNLDLCVQVPFVASRTAYQYISWQANDPLVHYLASDLNFTGTEPSGLQTGTHQWNDLMVNLPPNNLGQLNDRYQPWGRSLSFPNVDTSGYNLAYKDPLVRWSDNWNFPTNELAIYNWLGQIHRGTPWQTIYLKASDILGEIQNGANIGTNTWMNWTGDFDPTDAAAMAPVRDRHLVSVLAALLNTNDVRSLFSVNNSNPNAWLVLLDGLTALTNNLPDSLGLSLGVFPPQFGTLVISSNSPQASAIVDAVQSARTGQPGQFFREVGNILATPQLTEQSPFLNWNDGVQSSNGISDEAYEIIPSQLLSLLRADSIGSIATLNSQPVVQFTGYDGHAYAIEVSSDLLNWVSISTNCPVNGIFAFTNSAASNANQQFYRSILLQ